MENIESMIKTIEKVFNLSEENLSSLTVMLADIEAGRLYHRFSTENHQKTYLTTDILSKANLLNALLEIILENPNMESIQSNKRKDLIVGVSGIVASLYEQILEQIDDDNIWSGMPYLVMYSMLSYMADCQTISDLVVKEFNSKLVHALNLYDNFSLMEQLENDTYYLIVFLMSNIKNYEGLSQLNTLIDKANKNLDKAQNIEIDKEELDISTGLKIGAFGNIIYLTTLLKEYLFTGKIDVSENQDIFSVIDMYSYNAFYLLSNESIELKIIGHLLKYAYDSVAENSIWNIVRRQNVGGTNRTLF